MFLSYKSLVILNICHNLIEKKNFKIRNIKTNIKDIVTYDNFYVNSNFGTKGMLIDENDIYFKKP